MTCLRPHRVGIQSRQRPYSPPLELGFPGTGKTWDQGCELDLVGTRESWQCSEQGTSMLPGLAVCAQLQTKTSPRLNVGPFSLGFVVLTRQDSTMLPPKERSDDKVGQPCVGHEQQWWELRHRAGNL